MAEEILTGTLEHESVGYEAIHEIVKQLRQNPQIQQIINPIVMVEDFKSAFKCASEKTALSYSGRGYHHYKACAEVASDGLADAQAGMHTALVPYHYSQDTVRKDGNTS
jgi:hypothetical protein